MRGETSVTKRADRGVEAGVCDDTSRPEGEGGETSGLAHCEAGEEGEEALQRNVRIECILVVCVLPA